MLLNRNIIFFLGTIVYFFSVGVLNATPLQSYSININETSVSGVSSGAYMADQFHVAFSKIVTGAGLIGGGPYNCANNSIMSALGKCMSPSFISGPPDGTKLAQKARKISKTQQIDPLNHLKNNRVYIFSGTNDKTVVQEVSAQIAKFYLSLGIPATNIRYVSDIPAGHAMITPNYGNSCSTASKSPFINNCGRDEAGNILNHLHGNLNPPSNKPKGEIIRFDQSEFLPEPHKHSLSKTGFLYVPQNCAHGVTCKVHIAFHGCLQNEESISDAFIQHAGYNRWADTNNLIILYPQTSNTSSNNPKGCWDWWGYNGDNYYTKKGKQMSAVYAMLLKLAAKNK